MKKYIQNISAFLVLSVVLSFKGFSQEKTKITPYISVQYFKNTDDQRYLKTSLTFSKNRMEIPIPGMEVTFYNGTGKKNLIGTALTDNKGIAKIDLGKEIKLIADNSGSWAFSSEYKGNDTIEAGISEIAIKDLILEVIYNGADSIKTLAVSAIAKSDGKDKPAAAEWLRFMFQGCSAYFL
jgi:hypothetical protein